MQQLLTMLAQSSLAVKHSFSKVKAKAGSGLLTALCVKLIDTTLNNTKDCLDAGLFVRPLTLLSLRRI